MLYFGNHCSGLFQYQCQWSYITTLKRSSKNKKTNKNRSVAIALGGLYYLVTIRICPKIWQNKELCGTQTASISLITASRIHFTTTYAILLYITKEEHCSNTENNQQAYVAYVRSIQLIIFFNFCVIRPTFAEVFAKVI